MLICKSHHRPALGKEEFTKTVKWMVKQIKVLMKTEPVDSIAFCGMSGALIAGSIASKLDLHMLMVRKESEKEHVLQAGTPNVVSGDTDAENYVIVDDLICSGKTISWIIQALDSENWNGFGDGKKLTPKGIFLYYASGYDFGVDENFVPCWLKDKAKIWVPVKGMG